MTKKMCFCAVFLISVLLPPAVCAQQQDKEGVIKLSSREDIANFKKMLNQKAQQTKDGDKPVSSAQPEQSKDLPERPAFSDKDGVIVLTSQEDIKKFSEYLDKSGISESGGQQDQPGVLVMPAGNQNQSAKNR